MDHENIDPKSPSSPPSTEVSMGRDYVSSYTQISYFQNEESGDQTELETSDDEFSEELQPDDHLENDHSRLPELSSQIVEWSKKAFQTYDERDDGQIDDIVDVSEEHSTKSTIPDENRDHDRLLFFPMKFLTELESQTMAVAQNLNDITQHISTFSTVATSTSVEMMKLYQDNVFETCDTIDLNIKSMYRIMSKAEELNKSLKFLDDLKNKIKDIKQTLDTFERIIM